ncbi:MAG: cation transporter [Chloroflexi bacterium]|nr:cation transporter [Chloroflexota bacterium]
MQNLSYSVPNISCDHCVHTIKMEVGELEGVVSVKATVDDQKVIIEFDDPASEQQILNLMTEIYYPPTQ